MSTSNDTSSLEPSTSPSSTDVTTDVDSAPNSPTPSPTSDAVDPPITKSSAASITSVSDTSILPTYPPLPSSLAIFPTTNEVANALSTFQTIFSHGPSNTATRSTVNQKSKILKNLPPISSNPGDACSSQENALYACGWNKKTQLNAIVQCSVGTVLLVNDCVPNNKTHAGYSCVYLDYAANNSFYVPFCVPGDKPIMPPPTNTVNVNINGTTVAIVPPTPVIPSTTATTGNGLVSGATAAQAFLYSVLFFMSFLR